MYKITLLLVTIISGCASAPPADTSYLIKQKTEQQPAEERLAEPPVPVSSAAPLSVEVTSAPYKEIDSYAGEPIKAIRVIRKTVKEKYNANGKLESKETTEEVYEDTEPEKHDTPVPEQPKTFIDRVKAKFDDWKMDTLKNILALLAAIVGSIVAIVTGWFKLKTLFKAEAT